MSELKATIELVGMIKARLERIERIEYEWPEKDIKDLFRRLDVIYNGLPEPEFPREVYRKL